MKMSRMRISITVLCFVLGCVQSVLGQAALYVPPGRSAMWAHLGNAAYASNLTANFDYITNLNCAGNIVTPTTFVTSCGPCGDAIDPQNPNGVRPNEAPGGVYAIGEVVWYYHEGATINVTLDVRTPMAGGFYQFSICETDATTVVTHDCFTHKLTWADTGQSTIPAPTYSGYATYTLQLPVGLTCDNCVLQWKWIDGGFTCQMLDMLVCGPTVTNCADIAIVPQGVEFPHHFDWPRYDQYASIFAADGNPDTDHHTTVSTALTTAPIIESTTSSPTTSTSVGTTPSTLTTPQTTTTTPTTTTTTTSTTTPTTTTNRVVIIPTITPPSVITTISPSVSTEGEPTAAGTTTTAGSTTIETAKIVQGGGAAAVVPAAIGVTGLLTGNTTVGIIFLMLALLASHMWSTLQPFGGQLAPPSAGLPSALVPPNARFSAPLVPFNAGFPSPLVPPNAGLSSALVPPNAAFSSSMVPSNAGLSSSLFPSNAGLSSPLVPSNLGPTLPLSNLPVYPVMREYYNRAPTLQWYGQQYTGHNNYYSRFGKRYNGYGKKNSGYGNKKYKKSYSKGGYYGPKQAQSPRYMNRKQGQDGQWRSNHGYQNQGSYGKQENVRHGYQNNRGYGNNGVVNNGYQGNQHSQIPLGSNPLQGVVPEYDNEPAPTVVKSPRDKSECKCRGRFEVFTVYCMNYADDRDGCEAEGDICFCRS